MKTFRFLISAAIVETLGIGLAGWLFLATPVAATDSPSSSAVTLSDRFNSYILPNPTQREELVEAKLESTADRLSSIVADHFDDVWNRMFPANSHDAAGAHF